MSSKVIGLRSGPGSATVPASVVSGTAVGADRGEACVGARRRACRCRRRRGRRRPPRRGCVEPSTCSVIGRGARHRRRRRTARRSVPSVAGTIVAGAASAAGVGGVEVVGVERGRVDRREKMTCGRKVTPTSPAPSAGVTSVTSKGTAPAARRRASAWPCCRPRRSPCTVRRVRPRASVAECRAPRRRRRWRGERTGCARRRRRMA